MALPIVEVNVRRQSSQCVHRTRALLDTGSDRTFCSEALAEKLGKGGRTIQLHMDTMNCKTKQSVSEIDLEIMSVGVRKNRRLILSDVIVIAQLPHSLSEAAATAKEVNRWDHLRDIEVPTSDTDEVELLIGNDAPQALTPLEVRTGRDGSPFAIRTLLGWVVNGPMTYHCLRPQTTGCMMSAVATSYADQRLEDQVKLFWELETSHTNNDENLALSAEDERVLKLWSSTICSVDGHYQLPIPFREEFPGLPSNKILAERRLSGLRRRLVRNPELHQRYTGEIYGLLKAGYAERVPTSELNENQGLTWYLPHHPVLNPNKPGKLRVVFDCAAVHDSVSLNRRVLQGPDLNNTLLGVLLRFRQEGIAVSADIEAMFHQVKVAPPHRDALRFLWWPHGDMARSPISYRMKVHLFGGVWSPSCATYALRQTLSEHGGDVPAARDIANRSFYVDDLLMSVSSPREASVLAQQLRMLLHRGGFRLTKWMSNHKQVLHSIPPEDRHVDMKEVELSRTALPVERALGVMWDLHLDRFAIRIQVNKKPATKRGLLSVVSSVYDPLGFVSPVTITAKMIFQEECRRQKGWDEPLTDTNKQAWEAWLNELTNLSRLHIPRCYKDRSLSSPRSVQLHHFCDASQKAYGVSSYFRILDEQGKIHCSFIFGKARLAPIKPLTIPRLELCAAALAAKIDTSLRRELDYEMERSVFWTDSVLVLQYLANTERRFRIFVANRVASIRKVSSISQWRYVNTSLNPADHASRGLSATDPRLETQWIQAPKFLWQGESSWPKLPKMARTLGEDPELIACKTMVTTGRSNVLPGVFDALWRHYSSWHRLQKGVAWILRCKDRLKKQSQRDERTRLSVCDLKRARSAILLQVQRESFGEELKAIAKGSISKHSDVYRLEPHLGEDGLLRVGGRLRHAPLSPESRYPILIPRDHPVSELIVRETHEVRIGHSGREHTMATLRNDFWIPKCRRLVDKIIHNCVVCRRNNWRPTQQRQASLPADRVAPGKAPFATTGMDCFGPFLVKQGRKQFKRWGCLFTCMATRAIHLEVLASLDADALLNSVMRFAARRGMPERIRSDNGTNMVKADKELRSAMRNWKEDERLQNAFLGKQIDWVFNPPSASHMGGTWERQIRTVRKVLRAIIGSQVLDDERLHTLLCEVEVVVNSRPITPASEDPNDLDALTPTHLLRVGAYTHLPVSEHVDGEAYRRRWKHAQFLAEQFWKRWLREYLPLLRRRRTNFTPCRNFEEGDLVIVAGEPMPRNQWRLGRVVEPIRSDDGLVRQVKVKTARNILTRPVTKLCFLEGHPVTSESTKLKN